MFTLARVPKTPSLPPSMPDRSVATAVALFPHGRAAERTSLLTSSVTTTTTTTAITSTATSSRADYSGRSSSRIHVYICILYTYTIVCVRRACVMVFTHGRGYYSEYFLKVHCRILFLQLVSNRANVENNNLNVDTKYIISGKKKNKYVYTVPV